MSFTPIGDPRQKITVASLREKKLLHEPITCLTAYDYPSARLVDEAAIDIVLVGDSLAMTILGYENTLSVTIDEMLHHTKAARRGVKHALLVADMPYGSYHLSAEDALRNAARFVKEAGAEAVKIEGGQKRADLIMRLRDAELPVMGHIGLTPQSLHAMGGYKVQGKSLVAIEELMRWRPPLLHFRRTATEDHELGGKTIKAGDKVVLWYVSGNFDAEVFPEPDRLDLARQPNRHLAFGGGGVHFCLGAALGRQLVKSALREVYTQLPDIRIGTPQEGFSNLFNHMNRLPARWTPKSACPARSPVGRGAHGCPARQMRATGVCEST